ncbi:MAG: hypothetical protein AAGF83_27855 [Cyanobacteria bacterium P01_G01_bin.67]
MSHFLMIYIDDNINFDSDAIKQAIHRMSNAELSISKNKYSEGLIIYRLEEDEININIGEDWRFLAIENSTDTALDFAIQLNKVIDKNLSLTDSTYGFLCKLDEVHSLENLKKIIAKGIYMNE